MSEHHFDPNHPETRRLIDEHKAERLANPFVQVRFEYLRGLPHVAFKYFCEQIGDAELYEQAYRERVEADNE